MAVAVVIAFAPLDADRVFAELEGAHSEVRQRATRMSDDADGNAQICAHILNDAQVIRAVAATLGCPIVYDPLAGDG